MLMLLLSFPGMIHSGVFVERHYCRFAKKQQLKLHLQDKSPKTVNNVLATLRGASARCGATGVAGGSVED